MSTDTPLEQSLVARQGWVGGALILALLALFGGWAAVLLARSRRPPPPLPPYELPQLAADEPLPAPPDVPLAERQALVFTNHAEPQSLDPALMTGVPEMTIALGLFEGLTGLHPRTLQPVPGAAERWEVSPDGRSYVFHLRRAQWSNGDPVRAGDFVFAWRRALAPATAAEYAYMLFCIDGARAFNAGDHDVPSRIAARARDDLTLEVTLEHPVAYFLELAAFATCFPLHPDTVREHGDRWTRPEHMVSNGPFVLAEWRQQQHVLLRKNPRYWDAARVALDEIRVLPIDDAETALKQFRNREVHWIRSIPAPKVAAAARLPGFRYAPEYGTYFYRFNVTRPPLDDPRVRTALALAIDKDSIARYLLRGGQRPARSFVPPSLPPYEPVEGPACDPARARALLAEAGFPGGRGFPALQLLYNTSESHKLIAEAVQHMWRSELGVRIELLNQEWKVYLDSMSRLRYDIARSSWIGDYGDPNTFLDMFVTGGGNNRPGWSHPRYDRLVADAAREPDRARRFGLLRQAERILVAREMPIVPIYFYVNTYLVQPSVLGVYDNARNVHPFQYIAIAAEPVP